MPDAISKSTPVRVEIAALFGLIVFLIVATWRAAAALTAITTNVDTLTKDVQEIKTSLEDGFVELRDFEHWVQLLEELNTDLDITIPPL